MRLIDADEAEKAVVGYRYVAERRIRGVPTVEAIPIEWLKAWSKMYLEPTKEYTDIIEDIINDWREEQSNEID